MTLPRLRDALLALPGYQPSDGVHSAGRPPRLLSANESPHGPLPGVVEAIIRAAAATNRYPDPGCTVLTERIARAHGVTADQVAVGAGSVALLQTLYQAVADPGAEAVYAWPSFELYPDLAELAGVCPVPVPLTGGGHDLAAMAARITPRTRLVVVCNPNNPTGASVRAEELAAFVRGVPADCLVAVDEAYIEYVRDPAVTSALELIRRHPNLVVLRTFSKAYGLAALRVGYLIGAGQVVVHLRKGVPAYSVSSVAQAAAVAALGLTAELTRRVDTVVAVRTRLGDRLRRAGWAVPDSQANFVWLPLGDDAAAFGRWCADRRIAVRVFPGLGVRVTIGSSEDAEVFLAAAADWARRDVPRATGAPA